MMKTLTCSVIAGVVTLLVIMISVVLSYRTVKGRETKTPFECGFDPAGTPRVPFSLRFYLLAIVFLIFDIEVVLLFPLLIMITSSFSFSTFVGGFLFLVILAIGLLYESYMGTLDWAK